MTIFGQKWYLFYNMIHNELGDKNWEWPMFIFWSINWLNFFIQYMGKLGRSNWSSYWQETKSTGAVTAQPIWKGRWGSSYACHIFLRFPDHVSKYVLGLMYVIVLEFFNKDSCVTLACRVRILYTWCRRLQIHEQAMGGEDGFNRRVMWPRQYFTIYLHLS